MVKKAKKQIKNLAEVSMLGAGSAIAIGAVGGSAAGVQGATSMLGTTGRVVGAGLLMTTIGELDNATKRKKRNKL